MPRPEVSNLLEWKKYFIRRLQKILKLKDGKLSHAKSWRAVYIVGIALKDILKFQLLEATDPERWMKIRGKAKLRKAKKFIEFIQYECDETRRESYGGKLDQEEQRNFLLTQDYNWSLWRNMYQERPGFRAIDLMIDDEEETSESGSDSDSELDSVISDSDAGSDVDAQENQNLPQHIHHSHVDRHDGDEKVPFMDDDTLDELLRDVDHVPSTKCQNCNKPFFRPVGGGW